LVGLNTDENVPDGFRLENTLGRRWDVHTSSAFLRFNYDSGDGNSTNVAYVDTDGAWMAVSDRRLKQEIRPIDSVLARIDALEVVRYRLNHAAPGSERQLGLIAQNVAEQFPELASESEGSGYWGVNYAGFSVVALKAIQEQQVLLESLLARITGSEQHLERLEAENAKLRQLAERNDRLESRLAALEALLLKDHQVAEKSL